MNGYALAKQPDMAYMLCKDLAWLTELSQALGPSEATEASEIRSAAQFHQMQERGLQPNVYIYNALMKAQAGTGNIGEVNTAVLLHFAVLPGPICSVQPYDNQMGYTFNGTFDGQACRALSTRALHLGDAWARVMEWK
ncbi:MAG: hypothetical protein MMC33_008446 [Icmadophila ericetorum]|nr:hypothetical protein [Icmadophila ericetorum]